MSKSAERIETLKDQHMKTSHHIPLTVACSIGKDRVLAQVVVDRKNNSVHLHLHGEMFGKKRMPIQVKDSEMQFTEKNEVELITQILADHFSGQPVQILSIKKLNDQKDLNAPGDPFRIIVRFKD